MVDEIDDIDIDLSEAAPKRPPGPGRVGLYAFLAFVLAAACAFLVWQRNENVTALQRLEENVKPLEAQRDELQAAQDEVGVALVQLADYAASEAKLHHTLGDCKQALADLDQAMYLLDLAKKLGRCGCGDQPSGAVKKKIGEVKEAIQPTEEELSRIGPQPGQAEEQTEPASEPETRDQSKEQLPPVQKETGPGGLSVEKHPGGEPNA